MYAVGITEKTDKPIFRTKDKGDTMPHCASKVVILATGGTIVSSGASATQMTGYSIQGLGV